MDGENEKEIAVESGTEQPRVSRLREYMTAKFPDKRYTNDEDFEGDLADHLGALDGQISANAQANKTIMEVIEANPEFAQIIEDLAKGMPVSAALARHFAPEDFTPIEGEPDWEAYSKSAEERKSKLAQARERAEKFTGNMEASKADVDTFFADKGMDDTDRDEFIGWVDNELVGSLLEGRISKAMLEKLYQAWRYDEAVAEARQAGEVEGRNAQIEARRTAVAQIDNLPGQGAGAVPDAAPQAAPDNFVDEVIGRRNQRKF